MVMFMVGTNASVIAGLLPQIAETLGTTPATVSYSVTVYALIVAVAAPIASIALASVSRAVLMASGAVIYASGTAIAAASVDVVGLIAGRGLSAIGGAMLVPVATAVGASLVPPERRGRAMALIVLGFTLSGALGTPLGTVLGSLSSWRLPLWTLAGFGLIVGLCIVFAFRRLERPEPISFSERIQPLADRRVVATVAATLFMVASFNCVLIFSAPLTAVATGGSGVYLGLLLMTIGLSGIIGNTLAGRLTDRFGNRILPILALAAVAVLLGLLPLVLNSYALCVVLFGFLGVAVSLISVPVQHRLASIDERTASMAMAWNSTGMYLGIALAPFLGNLAIRTTGLTYLPLMGSACAIMAMAAYAIGFARPRARRGLVAGAADASSEQEAPAPAAAG